MAIVLSMTAFFF